MKKFRKTLLSPRFWLMILPTLGGNVIRWRAHYIGVDDLNIYYHKGVLGRDSETIPIHSAGVNVHQSVMGRFLSYGNVEIDSANSRTAITFENISRPNELRRVIQKQKRNNPAAGMPARARR